MTIYHLDIIAIRTVLVAFMNVAFPVRSIEKRSIKLSSRRARQRAQTSWTSYGPTSMRFLFIPLHSYKSNGSDTPSVQTTVRPHRFILHWMLRCQLKWLSDLKFPTRMYLFDSLHATSRTVINKQTLVCSVMPKARPCPLGSTITKPVCILCL